MKTLKLKMCEEFYIEINESGSVYLIDKRTEGKEKYPNVAKAVMKAAEKLVFEEYAGEEVLVYEYADKIENKSYELWGGFPVVS